MDSSEYHTIDIESDTDLLSDVMTKCFRSTKRALWAGAFALALRIHAAEPANNSQKQPVRADVTAAAIGDGPLAFGGRREEFLVGSNRAFLILPQKAAADGATPWIWYAPTFVRPERALPNRGHAWMFEQLLAKGFAVAGVDVGESFGNPAGRAVFTEFHREVVKRFGLSSKASLLPQSRGGLMLYNWAVEHPELISCIGGIYPVGDLSSWPGLSRASGAYGMTDEQLSTHLVEHNPIDRLTPLARARIPILHVHGDADTVVPLERNSAELARRYRAIGGEIELVVVAGKGHKGGPEFFQEQRLVDFFLRHGRHRVHGGR